VNPQQLPLVSIVTPVYNNEDYIAECIESVLAQTYTQWEYTIVDNCSTDRSGEIAERYAASDPRIRVIHNDVFLKSIPNHNHALRQISPKSKYCKVVFADDWILPQCIEEMVALAERNPSVGIVQAYILWAATETVPYEYTLKGGGFPYPSPCLPGVEVGRRVFLERFDLVGAATSLLYRADLVRARTQFFNEENFHGDRDTCLALLKQSDLGFVHQVLTFNRARPNSLNRIAREMYLDMGCMLQSLVDHGRDFLTDAEFTHCLKQHVAAYYNFLAVSLLRGQRDKGFWTFHTGKLSESVGFSNARLGWAIIRRALIALVHPSNTVSKLSLFWRMGRYSPKAAKADTEQLTVHAVELKS
jgi:glycosyltransferase involved in cell wall biosynthesis